MVLTTPTSDSRVIPHSWGRACGQPPPGRVVSSPGAMGGQAAMPLVGSTLGSPRSHLNRSYVDPECRAVDPDGMPSEHPTAPRAPRRPGSTVWMPTHQLPGLTARPALYGGWPSCGAGKLATAMPPLWRGPFGFAGLGLSTSRVSSEAERPSRLGSMGGCHSQERPDPVWYSITRDSKKFFSLPRSITSLIHGNGLVVAGNTGSNPS